METHQTACAEHDNEPSDLEGGARGKDATESPAVHRFDVFVSHGEGELSLARQIVDIIEAHELSCFFAERDFLPGTHISNAIADAVKSARRVVVLLSRQFLQTGWCTFQLLTSVGEMYDTQRALIVPVLVDITEAEVPPCLRNVSLVDVRRDPNYQHKLMDILTAPEVTLRELMPAGNVSHGLAWSYYLNYLRFILPDIARRVNNWCDQQRENSGCMDVRMPRKLYILVPASCFCPAKLESSGRSGNIRFGGHLENVIKTTAGSVDRVYKHTVWTIHRENGEVLQFVGEYSNVLHTLYLMECERGTGLDAQQLQLQRDQFLRLLQNLLTCYGHDTQAKVVFFHDKDDEGNVTLLPDIIIPLVEQDRLPLAPLPPHSDTAPADTTYLPTSHP